jgi:hypothetical protein
MCDDIALIMLEELVDSVLFIYEAMAVLIFFSMVCIESIILTVIVILCPKNMQNIVSVLNR